MSTDISIIMAVYNGAGDLERALKGIARQDFKDFEVLIIDDGSTDRTPEIAEKFCKEDQRFKLYRKDNGGVASARNVGLDKARGTYIIHHDADDRFPDRDILSALYQRAVTTKSDIVIGDYEVVIKNGTRRINQEFHGEAPELIQALLDNRYHAGLWNKLIRRQLYNGLRFVEGANYMEDKLLMTRVLYSHPKIDYLPKIVYAYNIKNQSAYHISDAAIDSFKQVIDHLETDFKKFDLPYDLTYQKLTYKLICILNQKQIDHKKVFREANAMIFKTKTLPGRHKILLFFEAIGIRFISKFYLFFLCKNL